MSLPSLSWRLFPAIVEIVATVDDGATVGEEFARGRAARRKRLRDEARTLLNEQHAATRRRRRERRACP